MAKVYPLKNKRSLRENMEHVLPLMYDDLMRYKDIVTARPLAKAMLHNMRKTGKPLRYAMEIGESAFGDEFKKCLDEVKDTVEMMGEIHDADVMIPEIETQLREIRLFNQTLPVFKERLSTRGLRKIIEELKTKRRENYASLCDKLNTWEKKNFRKRIVDSMVTKTIKRIETVGLVPRTSRITGTLGERSLQKNKNEQIITSKLLSKFPEIVHGMSTKIGIINEPPFYNNMSSKIGDKPENVKVNRAEFLGRLGIKETQLAVPHQIHSDNIEIVEKAGFYPDRDGLITSAKNVYMVVSTADCIPVLIYDKAKHVVAAIHSGWRGTQKNIVGKTLGILKEKFLSAAGDLVIFIGPGISKKHFEVGEDVASMFDAKYIEVRGEKFYVNILGNVLDQIKSYGVKAPQIEYSRKCSFAEINYLHSYRRDKEKSGRMFSIIGMKSVD